MPPLSPEEAARWKAKINSCNISSDWKDGYVYYIERLTKHKAAIIFEEEHLASLMGVTRLVLYSAINDTHAFYRSFDVPKRRGGTRRIDAPLPSLLLMQRWIDEEILKFQCIHSAAQAYTFRKSHISHANAHVDAVACLKIDLKDFFSSFSSRRITAYFKFLGYTPTLSSQMSALTTLDGKMPQGAATSPSLSNILCLSLDRRLSAYAECYRLVYTRYSDDICISGASFSKDLINNIYAIIHSEGFQLNRDKCVLMTERGRRIITGISIGSGVAKPPKAFRRRLRQDVHAIKQHGILNASKCDGKFDPLYGERVLGRLNYWLQIEPKNEYVIEAKDVIFQAIREI